MQQQTQRPSTDIAQTLAATTVGQVQGRLVEQKYPDLLTEECKVLKPDKVLKYGTAGESRWNRIESVNVGRDRKQES